MVGIREVNALPKTAPFHFGMNILKKLTSEKSVQFCQQLLARVGFQNENLIIYQQDGFSLAPISEGDKEK